MIAPDYRVMRALVATILAAALCFMASPQQLCGAELKEDLIKSAVETWVRFITAEARSTATVERMERHQIGGKTVAYIAHLSGGGYCLCGADDLVLPVYFYSPAGTYDSSNPDLQFILEEIGTRLETTSSALARQDVTILAYKGELAKRAASWQDLSSGAVPVKEAKEENLSALAEPSTMELNLTTRWHQSYPYNNFCPTGYNGRRCVAGCVATATAQIMNYWSFPANGTGTRSYDWNGDQSCSGGDAPGHTLTINFAYSHYDWASMPDYCSSCSQTEQDALAELLYNVGVAVKMDYGACGSGAYSTDVVYALENYFLYDADAALIGRDINKMTEDIQWLRPVYIDGDNGTDGHGWVVYGYNKATDPNRQFKMNMGWGGSSDGWYTCDSVPLNLNNGQHNIIRVAPETGVKFVGASDGGDGTPDNPYQNIEEAVSKAASGTTLIFKAGSTNYFSVSQLVINRPMVLKGKDITIRY